MRKPVAVRVLGILWWALVLGLAALIVADRITTPAAWAIAAVTIGVFLLQSFLARRWDRENRQRYPDRVTGRLFQLDRTPRR